MTDEISIQVARLDERVNAASKALEIATTELHRRLDELNHAHKQRMERDREFVGLDKYDGLVRELHTFRDFVNKSLAQLEGRTAGLGTARSNLFQVLGAALLASALAVSIFAIMFDHSRPTMAPIEQRSDPPPE